MSVAQLSLRWFEEEKQNDIDELPSFSDEDFSFDSEVFIDNIDQ